MSQDSYEFSHGGRVSFFKSACYCTLLPEKANGIPGMFMNAGGESAVSPAGGSISLIYFLLNDERVDLNPRTSRFSTFQYTAANDGKFLGKDPQENDLGRPFALITGLGLRSTALSSEESLAMSLCSRF